MYNFTILTLEKTVYFGHVNSVILPGGLGYLEILAHHTPILTVVKDGRLEIKAEYGKYKAFHIKGGVLDVSNNQATLLADAIEELVPQPPNT